MSRRKIVVRSVNWLGDAVMSTSGLQLLRKACPDATITILAHEKLVGLWQHQPYVDDVMAFTSSESPLQIGRRLRWGNFDLALLLPNSPRSALEAWFGRIPARIGFASPWWRDLLLTRSIPRRVDEVKMHKRSRKEVERLVSLGGSRTRFRTTAHQTRSYTHLVAQAFGTDPIDLPPRIEVLPSEISSFVNRLNIASPHPILGINAGAEYGPAKRWPKERFVEAAQIINRKQPISCFVFGGRNDEALAAYIAAELRSIGIGPVWNLAGQTSLRELCAAFKLCSVLLSNDTGPMHLAAAVGTPVVVPFGSTSPELTGPGYGSAVPHKLILGDVPCAPCFLRECPIDLRCLNSITSDRVAQEILALLSCKPASLT